MLFWRQISSKCQYQQLLKLVDFFTELFKEYKGCSLLKHIVQRNSKRMIVTLQIFCRAVNWRWVEEIRSVEIGRLCTVDSTCLHTPHQHRYHQHQLQHYHSCLRYKYKIITYTHNMEPSFSRADCGLEQLDRVLSLHFIYFPSVLWHCWLGDRKGIWSVKSWVLVCWWWFDWSFACLTPPSVTTASIILSFNKTG